MITNPLNPFLKEEGKNHILIYGTMFDSFWMDMTTIPETISTPLGTASGIIAFHTYYWDQLEYLYLEPVKTALYPYGVTIQTGGRGPEKTIIGYSTSDLLSHLAHIKQVRPLPDDNDCNYNGFSFLYDKNKRGNFLYCLSLLPDMIASLRLLIKVEKLQDQSPLLNTKRGDLLYLAKIYKLCYSISFAKILYNYRRNECQQKSVK